MFGPGSSQFVRPVYQALAGFVSIAGPDELTWVLNRLGVKPETLHAEKDPKTGKIMMPSESIQEVIDAYTTAPTETKTKVMELINTMALGGIASPRLPAMIGKYFPQVSQEAKALARRGVTLTPGQLYGKTINFMEEQLAKLHYAPKAARAKAIEQWNRLQVNDALEAAGGSALPKTERTGRTALSWAYKQFGEMYRDALSRVRVNVGRDPQFNQATTNARALYARARSPLDPNPANLDENASLILKDIIDNKIWGNVSRTGEVSGDQLKHIEEVLRVNIGKLEGSQDYHERHVAEILTTLRNEFKGMVERQNPGTGARLAQIDRGYAKYKTAERAARISTTHEGVYTPGQRLQAIRARDESLDKGAFARGEAYDQTEAEAAQRVMGNKLPDSGTAGGVTMLELLTGATAAAGGKATGHLLPALGAIAAPFGVYSQPALRGIQALATRGGGPSALGLLGAARQQGWNPVSPSPAPPLLADPTQVAPNPLEEFIPK